VYARAPVARRNAIATHAMTHATPARPHSRVRARARRAARSFARIVAVTAPTSDAPRDGWIGVPIGRSVLASRRRVVLARAASR
jgi:hypothetical protein